MPVYEFECPKCSTQFELTRPMSKAGSAASCPKEKKSHFPEPTEYGAHEHVADASLTRGSPDDIALHKERKGKEGKTRATRAFKSPSLEDVKSYILENHYAVNPDKFFNHYESQGWLVGKNKMKSWKSAIASWNSREQGKQADQIQVLGGI